MLELTSTNFESGLQLLSSSKEFGVGVLSTDSRQSAVPGGRRSGLRRRKHVTLSSTQGLDAVRETADRQITPLVPKGNMDGDSGSEDTKDPIVPPSRVSTPSEQDSNSSTLQHTMELARVLYCQLHHQFYPVIYHPRHPPVHHRLRPLMSPI